jgi:hypothetical protein
MREGALSSSNLASYAYDEASQELTIAFTNGNRYLYAGVPSTVVDGLVAAPSAGKYFHANIRSSYRATPA